MFKFQLSSDRVGFKHAGRIYIIFQQIALCEYMIDTDAESFPQICLIWLDMQMVFSQSWSEIRPNKITILLTLIFKFFSNNNE